MNETATSENAEMENVENTNDENKEVSTQTDDYSAEIARLKNALTKSNNEAAELKKQLRSKMTKDEADTAEREAKWAEMEAKLKELETEKTISTYKASYLAMQGFDEKLAEETAKALAEGDMKTVFANQQKANAAYEKKLRADLVKQDPKPAGAGGGNEEKDEAVEFAKKLGKQRADALKNANEGLKHYF